MEKIKFNFKDITIFFLVSIISNFLTIRLSFISGDIINKIYDKTLMDNLLIYSMKLILIVVLAMGSVTIKNSYRVYLVSNKSGKYRTILYNKILNKKLGEFKKNAPSYYHNLLYSDIETLRGNYLNSKLLMMDSVLLLLGASISITNIHYVFLIIAILSAFIPYLIPKFFEGYMDRQRVVNSKASEDYISFVKEGVLGVETIRDYHIEDNFIEDFSKYKNNLLESGNKLMDIQNLIVASSIFSGFLMYAVILSSGVLLHNRGLISIGAIFVASQLTNSIKSPVIDIINNKIYMNSTKSIREKLLSELTEDKIIEKDKNFSFKDKISIENLSFSYDGENRILEDVNLEIYKNNKYLIIGESGSGKSTFFKILMKWIENFSGNIFVDSKNTNEITTQEWNKEFVPVLQETYIFEKSVGFNITFEENYDEKRLAEAIKTSGLSDFVSKLDKGINTVIKGDGSNISGGEKKRIGIARALYKNGNVLLVDEPFSSIDKKTQEQIEKMLLSLEDKTILNISHSYDENFIRQYDYVIHFENGIVRVFDSKSYCLNDKDDAYDKNK
ncbi:ATP-binding cassette domain-containing protein [Mediannikoviicoccus vaginalis]|uniref:ATP-binding cassette domain-containing protein n=1 Tax=Mediannikoviicoccus vaginalis TaxID=2899727 RepID=UPI001F1EC0A4|nr:ABC transporter ATP-binding protein [Mediannikoviicoccus vaginalis]